MTRHHPDLQNLIRLIPQNSRRARRISAFNIHLTHRQGQDSPKLNQRQLLPNTIPGTELKGPESVLARTQRVLFSSHPALGQELCCARPEFVQSVHEEADAEYHHPFGWVLFLGVWVREEEAWLAFADCSDGWEETQGFFDHCGCVWELVEEGWECGELGAGFGGVGSKYGVVLGAKRCECGWVLV